MSTSILTKRGKYTASDTANHAFSANYVDPYWYLRYAPGSMRTHIRSSLSDNILLAFKRLAMLLNSSLMRCYNVVNSPICRSH
ncbi:hypothetical protein [Candidatus Pseudomonas adelgestsugas]|uniref:hypothetical protein n=1 Tax=Candidatus Pseudomonas adelgestsugas TaxID=1302376 RepID=UPI00100FC784|nr:hypothetical protein [Candidatus Pseudomonas adelgestsugas]